MTMLVFAYILVWLAIFLYVARLHFEQRRLSRELEKLQARLK
ncbi:MAG: CcmD family protein [Pirellulales bacterium]|nr:CcmD family protein [Pirellulales bacterium]